MQWGYSRKGWKVGIKICDEYKFQFFFSFSEWQNKVSINANAIMFRVLKWGENGHEEDGVYIGNGDWAEFISYIYLV